MSNLALRLVWETRLFLLSVENDKPRFPPAWFLFWITLHSAFLSISYHLWQKGPEKT